MKIAVYVGSFNPVHKGHIKVVKKILKEYVDKVIIVPTMSYWNKNNLISIKDRINMLKIYNYMSFYKSIIYLILFIYNIKKIFN